MYFHVTYIYTLLQSAGNEAFQSGKYREAVAHYSNAIKQSIESRPFTAICLCNRAAALQALGEVMDAIADCNLAIALDEDYMKVRYLVLFLKIEMWLFLFCYDIVMFAGNF